MKLRKTLVGRDSRSRTHGLSGGSGTRTAHGVAGVLVVFACWAGSFAVADDSTTPAAERTAEKPTPVRIEFLPPEREDTSGRSSSASDTSPRSSSGPSQTSGQSSAASDRPTAAGNSAAAEDPGARRAEGRVSRRGGWNSRRSPANEAPAPAAVVPRSQVETFAPWVGAPIVVPPKPDLSARGGQPSVPRPRHCSASPRIGFHSARRLEHGCRTAVSRDAGFRNSNFRSEKQPAAPHGRRVRVRKRTPPGTDR